MSQVTIVIPCYNHGEVLLEALESIRRQTFDDYEVVIVNDGSTESKTLEVLESLEGSELTVITTENRGVAAARNLAITRSAGDFILPLDADDRIAPDYIAKAMAVFQVDPDVEVVCCDQMQFGLSEHPIVLPDYDLRKLLVRNLLHVSAIFRKSVWERSGGYCERMNLGWEDWEFWISAECPEPRVVKLSEPLHYYRFSAESRDNSMKFSAKLRMFGLMVWRHRLKYFKNFPYVLKMLAGHFLSGPISR